jgi:hypothetical protein
MMNTYKMFEKGFCVLIVEIEAKKVDITTQAGELAASL